MNKIFTLLILVTVLAGCASTDNSSFSSALWKEWKLIEVHIENPIVTREVLFDRASLSKENAGKAFTLKFEEDKLSGTAAPNTYSGPYTLGEEEKSITISPLVTTMMAALWQPERIREQDYFLYMSNVYKWDIVENRLILFTKNEADQEVLMVFSR